MLTNICIAFWTFTSSLLFDTVLLVTDDDLSSIPESRDVSEDGSTDSAFGDVMKVDDVNSLRRRASV